MSLKRTEFLYASLFTGLLTGFAALFAFSPAEEIRASNNVHQIGLVLTIIFAITIIVSAARAILNR
jgi:uncharacterized membrane protein YhaH (DUF805 family)